MRGEGTKTISSTLIWTRGLYSKFYLLLLSNPFNHSLLRVLQSDSYFAFYNPLHFHHLNESSLEEREVTSEAIFKNW